MNSLEESVSNLNSINDESLNITIPKTSLGDDDNQVNNKTCAHQPEESLTLKRGGNKRRQNPKDVLTPPGPGREGGGWECSICTFRNSAKTFSCEICSTRKGTSTRKPRLNSNLIAQQALAAVDKGSNPTPTQALANTPPAANAISTPPPLDPIKTCKKSSKPNTRKGATKLKPGPKGKAKPPAEPEDSKDADCNFKKNLDIAADTLLLLSSSPTPHRPLKKRPTLTPPSPPPPQEEPPSFLATLMMSSPLGPAPLPTPDAYLNFLHSWKRKGGHSPSLTPRTPASPPQPPVPPPFCQYLNQFKNLPDPSRSGHAPPLPPGSVPPSQGSGSASSRSIDSEDEMYMTRILATVPSPEQLINPHPPAAAVASKCRKKRWMDRLNNNGPTPNHESPPPPDHVDVSVPMSRDAAMTSPSLVGIREEGGSSQLISTMAPNGVIKRAVKLKKNQPEPPAPDQYSFDHKAPKTYQVTVNGLTVDITDYPLLSTTPVT